MATQLWRPGPDQPYVLMLDSNEPPPDEAAHPAWIRDNRRYGRLCECKGPHPKLYPAPFDVLLRRPLKLFATMLCVQGPRILHRDAYEVLAPFNRTAAVGQVFLKPAGGPRTEAPYVTLYDIRPNLIQIRGDKLVDEFECDVCGDWVPWYRGNMYIRQQELGNRLWFLSGGTIFAKPELARKINLKKFPDCEPYRIWIRDDV